MIENINLVYKKNHFKLLDKISIYYLYYSLTPSLDKNLLSWKLVHDQTTLCFIFIIL